MANVRKYERDIDLLLAEEFEVSPSFAAWFISRIKKFAPLKTRVVDVAVSKSDYLGESDLVVTLEIEGSEQRIAVFIEDKIDAPFQPDQLARYRARAEAGMPQLYSDYQVVLCSPQGYPSTHPEVALFDAFVSYEEMAAYFASRDAKDRRSSYRANFLVTAASRTSITYKQTVDPVTNQFWEAAYDIATREFPDLQMKVPGFTKGQTWIDFRPSYLPAGPQRVVMSLKGNRGFMDLAFSRTDSAAFHRRIATILESDMTVHQTFRSTAIRIVVKGFEVTPIDDAALTRLRSAFAACVRLIRFYRAHELDLADAAAQSPFHTPATKLSLPVATPKSIPMGQVDISL